MSQSAPLSSLINFLNNSQSPHHVVDNAVELLGGEFDGYEYGSLSVPHSGYLRVDGSLIAWRFTDSVTPSRFNMIGTHTDSPTLRIRPRPDIERAGLAQLGVEIYGGVLLNSWLDRDLGLAGQVVLTDGTSVLVRSDGAIARVPQLAIHLDRDVNERGLQLDKHAHMSPIWSSLPADGSFVDWLGLQIGVARENIAAWSLSLFDAQPAAVLGSDSSMLSSGRLDNQVSCWSSIMALKQTSPRPGTVNLVAMFDHEEVGSASANGADSVLLPSIIDSIFDHFQVSPDQRRAAIANSNFVSCDNAHGVHPNYPERHDQDNAPLVNGGVAIKINESQRYASTPRSIAMILEAFTRAGVPPQVFVSRNNIPCGSTIGPTIATRLGISTVDIGLPQLSMHSAREICGIGDIADLHAVMSAYFTAS